MSQKRLDIILRFVVNDIFENPFSIFSNFEKNKK